MLTLVYKYSGFIPKNINENRGAQGCTIFFKNRRESMHWVYLQKQPFILRVIVVLNAGCEPSQTQRAVLASFFGSLPYGILLK